MTRRAISALLLAAPALTSPRFAQTKDPWIGRRAFLQFGGVLKVSDTIVFDQGRTTSLQVSGHDRRAVKVYRVEHANGESPWLHEEGTGVAGRVQSKYVVPCEQAVEFYTDQIRANPKANSCNDRGNIWLEEEEYDVAIGDYNEAIRLEPGEAIY